MSQPTLTTPSAADTTETNPIVLEENRIVVLGNEYICTSGNMSDITAPRNFTRNGSYHLYTQDGLTLAKDLKNLDDAIKLEFLDIIETSVDGLANLIIHGVLTATNIANFYQEASTGAVVLGGAIRGVHGEEYRLRILPIRDVRLPRFTYLCVRDDGTEVDILSF